MRFYLTLNIIKESYSTVLPLNYQHECSALIYKVLHNANQDYATWLHQNGFIGYERLLELFIIKVMPSYKIEDEFAKVCT